MNPYVIDLEKIVKERSRFYVYFRIVSWFVLVYVSVWSIVGSLLFIAYKMGMLEVL